MVNEELTAEEWKRRYERERDRNARLKGIIEKMEKELARWRDGKLFLAHALLLVPFGIPYTKLITRALMYYVCTARIKLDGSDLYL